MAIIKEWICMAHGPFESAKSMCPKGCTTVERRFFTAPAIKTNDRTKNIDKTLQQLADDYKMTDIGNQYATAAVKRPDPKAVNQMEAMNEAIKQKFGVGIGGGWGAMPDSGGAVAAAQSLNAAPTVDMSSVKQTLPDWRQNVIVHAKDDSKIPT
jgi:hypothetical protein